MFARCQKADAVYYATIDYSLIHEVINRLSLKPDDIFVDVGCGKGRVLCLAARHRCRKVIGIEYSDEFCDEARANANRMRGRRTPILVLSEIAEDFDYSYATVLYFFNPFGAPTLNLVLEKIRTDTSGRPIRMAFVNVTAAQAEVFAKHVWLDGYETWETRVGSVKLYRCSDQIHQGAT
jgi:SAM-dependent methyltransferase